MACAELFFLDKEWSRFNYFVVMSWFWFVLRACPFAVRSATRISCPVPHFPLWRFCWSPQKKKKKPVDEEQAGGEP